MSMRWNPAWRRCIRPSATSWATLEGPSAAARSARAGGVSPRLLRTRNTHAAPHWPGGYAVWADRGGAITLHEAIELANMGAGVNQRLLDRLAGGSDPLNVRTASPVTWEVSRARVRRTVGTGDPSTVRRWTGPLQGLDATRSKESPLGRGWRKVG